MKVFVLDYLSVDKDLFRRALCECPEHRKTAIEQTMSPTRRDELLWGWTLLRYAFVEELGVDINALLLKYGEFGKPCFEGCDAFFSLSHSAGTVAVCVSKDPVGLDIERIQKKNDRIKERLFTPAEAEYIDSSSDPDLAFFEIYTAKESYMKYTGMGFALPMSRFEIETPLFCIKDVPITKLAFGGYRGALCGSYEAELCFADVNKILQHKK